MNLRITLGRGTGAALGFSVWVNSNFPATIVINLQALLIDRRTPLIELKINANSIIYVSIVERGWNWIWWSVGSVSFFCRSKVNLISSSRVIYFSGRIWRGFRPSPSALSVEVCAGRWGFLCTTSHSHSSANLMGHVNCSRCLVVVYSRRWSVL